jgi:hypothetical protein
MLYHQHQLLCGVQVFGLVQRGRSAAAMRQYNCHCLACVDAAVCCLQWQMALRTSHSGTHLLPVSSSSVWCCFSALVDACLVWLMTPQVLWLIHSGWSAWSMPGLLAIQNTRRALIGIYHLLHVKAAAHSMYVVGPCVVFTVSCAYINDRVVQRDNIRFLQGASTALVVCTPGSAGRTVVHAYGDCIPADMCDACSCGCSRVLAQQRKCQPGVAVQWKQVVLCSVCAGKMCLAVSAPFVLMQAGAGVGA